MSEFTQIENENPVVIPPTAEKVYDKFWLSHIRINSTGVDNAQAIAHLAPYNGESILDEAGENIVIDNLFTAMVDENRPAALRTLLAQTMDLLLQTIKAEREYQKTLQTNEEVI